MDAYLYDLSIPAISSLQSTLKDQAGAMQAVSVIFDPKYAFLIYSPIAFLLDQQVGKRLIMTTVITEWLNMILKWFLHGERPYWYVHSSGHFDPNQVPIHQFPITCELGPGHPSGHAMVTAAVWYIILDACLQAYSAHFGQQHTSSRPQQEVPTTPVKTTSGQLPVWGLYALILVTVSVSRVFLGCHFPHQCMAGALLGLLVARWVSRLEGRAHHFVGLSAFLISTAFATFALLQWLGFDPSWTIKLATKHCVKREYIHLDTAPFFSVMRYAGFALGTGLGLLAQPYRQQLLQAVDGQALLMQVAGKTTDGAIHESMAASKASVSSRQLSWLSFKLLAALLMARLVDNLGLFVSHAYLPHFYSAAFLAYTAFSAAFVNL